MSVGALLPSFCSSAPERSQRPTVCAFAPAQTLGPIVNSPKEEGSPTVSADETKLFFTSGRNGQEDLFVSMRPGSASPWGEPANLGDSVNDSIGDDFSLRLAMNGLALYFASNRVGGFGAGDLYVTTRDSLDHVSLETSTGRQTDSLLLNQRDARATSRLVSRRLGAAPRPVGDSRDPAARCGADLFRRCRRRTPPYRGGRSTRQARAVPGSLAGC